MFKFFQGQLLIKSMKPFFVSRMLLPNEMKLCSFYSNKKIRKKNSSEVYVIFIACAGMRGVWPQKNVLNRYRNAKPSPRHNTLNPFLALAFCNFCQQQKIGLKNFVDSLEENHFFQPIFFKLTLLPHFGR